MDKDRTYYAVYAYGPKQVDISKEVYDELSKTLQDPELNHDLMYLVSETKELDYDHSN